MCDLCEDDGTRQKCPDCGRRICLDAAGFGQLEAPAAFTSRGGPYCLLCAQSRERLYQSQKRQQDRDSVALREDVDACRTALIEVIALLRSWHTQNPAPFDSEMLESLEAIEGKLGTK